MSFGFSISDFITVGEFAWKLYNDCFKVARGAPQEFQLLRGEISTLANAIRILLNEAKDPTSTLVQAGEDRVRTVNELVKEIADTLKRLEKIAQKYAILGSGTKPRQLWTRFKWSVECSDIDKLRSKLVYQNSIMNLLLTSAGNSSLERIVSSTTALQNDVKEIKSYILGDATTQAAQIPSLSVVDDEVFKASLSAALMRNAEISQPWSTIGVDIWIEAGRWWLLRSQIELYTVSAPKGKVPLAAYANLIKSSWILVDIISDHPQVQFVTANTHSEVRSLSAELKNEFARLSGLDMVTPDLGELEGQDLQIWEVTSRPPLLRPHKDTRGRGEWKVASGEQVLFQRFAVGEFRLLPDPLPCIILFLVQGDASAARLVAQCQDGSIIMTVTFQQPVSHTQIRKSVTINDVKLLFNTIQDPQTLGSMIEATSWYMSKRTAAHTHLNDLKAFVLLTAVKNLCDDAVASLLQRTTWKGDTPSDSPEGSATYIAVSIASLHLKRELNQQLLESDLQSDADRDQLFEDDCERKGLSLWTWAIECGHHSLVELLAKNVPIERNRDAFSKRRNKMTPLGLASACGHEAIARTLLAKGAYPNEVDRIGDAALHYASRNGHEETARLLLRHDAKVESETGSGYTSLLVAAEQGHANIIQILIDHAANIEARDRSGKTAIIVAARERHEAAINLLLDEGANLLATDETGMEARHWLVSIERDRPCFNDRRQDYKKVRPASNDLVATVYKRACNIMHPSLPCPPLIRRRRAEIIFNLNARWAQLWLCSHHAYMEIPPNAVPNLTQLHKRTFRIDPPSLKVTFRFNIIHQEDTLDFTIAHAAGIVGLQVVGGGERGERYRSHFFHNIKKWAGVELDPAAEFVDPAELE